MENDSFPIIRTSKGNRSQNLGFVRKKERCLSIVLQEIFEYFIELFAVFPKHHMAAEYFDPSFRGEPLHEGAGSVSPMFGRKGQRRHLFNQQFRLRISK